MGLIYIILFIIYFNIENCTFTFNDLLILCGLCELSGIHEYLIKINKKLGA